MSAERALTDVRRALFVHAHPDDETLATGGLIAFLADRGVEVSVLTATRGELGEIVPGPLSGLTDAALARHRERELAAACAVLGVAHHGLLGTPPARAAGLPPRRYTDSGMRWLDAAETLAGPGDTAGPDALTAASPAEVAADIAAFAGALGVELIVAYDADGGYGHPDHRFLNAPSRTAAQTLGVRFLELVSHPSGGPSGDCLDTPDQAARVAQALACYPSQLTLDGDEVVHVGGQRQAVALRFCLRP